MKNPENRKIFKIRKTMKTIHIKKHQRFIIEIDSTIHQHIKEKEINQQ